MGPRFVRLFVGFALHVVWFVLFGHRTRRNLLLHRLLLGKIVVNSIHLALAGRASGVRDAETKGIGEFLLELLNQSSLADTGRTCE